MLKKMISACIGLACTAMLIAGGSMVSMAEENTTVLEPAKFYGTIEKDGTDRIVLTTSDRGEIVLHVSDETKILDAVDGLPIAMDDLTDGEVIYAYTSPVMTMSLPPQTHAILILGEIPADFKVPSLEKVDTLVQESEGNYVVETVSGQDYTINSETTMIPFLTRNMVFPESLVPGTQFLIWTTSTQPDVATKIVVFADGQLGGSTGAQEERPNTPSQVIGDNTTTTGDTTTEKNGWVDTDGAWYFYKDGQMQKGWITTGNNWYYLNPETGVMQTGFVTVNGNTYYLLEDGRMLTEARTFVPDENGVLH